MKPTAMKPKHRQILLVYQSEKTRTSGRSYRRTHCLIETSKHTEENMIVLTEVSVAKT